MFVEYANLLGRSLGRVADSVASEPLMVIGGVALVLGGYASYGVKGTFIFFGCGVFAYMLWNNMLPF